MFWNNYNNFIYNIGYICNIENDVQKKLVFLHFYNDYYVIYLFEPKYNKLI